METPPPVPLRPLTIGEIFDRAITLYARNFVVLTVMVLTVVLPLGVLQYSMLPETQLLQQDVRVLQHLPTPGHPQAQAPPSMPALSPAQWGAFGVLLLLTLLLLPIATNTVALGVASLYAGRMPELRSCYQTVMRRWPRLIGVVILEGAALFTGYGMGVLIIAVLAVIGVVLVKTFVAAAVAIFILVILAVIALILALMMLVIAATFALFGVTMENLGVTAAFAAGMARIFNRKQFKTSLLMTLAYIALYFAVGIISLTASALFLLVLKNVFLQAGFSIIINAILSAFLTVLLAVFYYDVRIRREGFDLEADLQRISTT